MGPITLLTDYGPGTEHVGALHAVLASRASGVERIDLAHDVPAGEVRWGAILLAELAALAPPGVHLAVVDPGVGGPRRAVAVRCDGGRMLVGPDNGLLALACDAFGAEQASEITSPALLGERVSATFHGRDIFAPAAAHLACGGVLADLGEPVDVATLARPTLPAARVSDGAIEALAVGCDAFGNLTLLARPDALPGAGLTPEDHVWIVTGAGRRHRAIVARTFADVTAGVPIVYVDAHDLLAIAINGGDARAILGIAVGEAVAITR